MERTTIKVGWKAEHPKLHPQQSGFIMLDIAQAQGPPNRFSKCPKCPLLSPAAEWRQHAMVVACTTAQIEGDFKHPQNPKHERVPPPHPLNKLPNLLAKAGSVFVSIFNGKETKRNTPSGISLSRTWLKIFEEKTKTCIQDTEVPTKWCDFHSPALGRNSPGSAAGGN